MTLQTSGTISLSNLQTEFSGVNPISLSEYYRGGSYVELSAPTVGIPASGLVSLSNYYGKADVPPFSAVLKWSGLITASSTLDVSTYATTPYSTLVVVQLYTTGAESFYYPPTTKMNSVDMPLIKSQYSNAFDDGRAISISSVSVAAGGTYTLTWTSTGTGTYGAVYEVLGFRDMYAALHAVATSQNLTSNNGPAPTSVTLPTPANGVNIFITSTTTDVTGVMEQYNAVGSYGIGWDTNPPVTSITYTCANAITVTASFNEDLA